MQYIDNLVSYKFRPAVIATGASLGLKEEQFKL
jgi:hypothetical protein